MEDSNPDQTKLNDDDEDDDIDRISELPDSVLCKILSHHLPTKYAVAASILSTRWKSLFPFFWLPPITLDLDDSLLLLHPSHNLPNAVRTVFFIDFVDNLLTKTLLFNVDYIQFLKLNCDNLYGDYKIISWLNAALALNVRELLLRVRLMSSRALFHSLNGCTTLTRLELGKGFRLWVSEGFTLPNLKQLVLFELRFDKVYMFNGLIEGCPVLEDLCLSGCNLEFFGTIRIQSLSLKKLSIKDSWKDHSMCELQLAIPNLEVLVYDDIVAGSYSLSDFKSLVTARVDLRLTGPESNELDLLGNADAESFWQSSLEMVLHACSSTVHLYLAAPSLSTVQPSSMQLPEFHNLTLLAVGRVMGSEGWALLAHLLCNAPNLEKLRVDEGFGEHDGGYSSFNSVVPNTPICLELHVKEIKFRVFEEDEDEIKLIEYFLDNGKVLQKLELHCLPCSSNSSRLQMLSRHSKIQFRPR